MEGGKWMMEKFVYPLSSILYLLFSNLIVTSPV